MPGYLSVAPSILAGARGKNSTIFLLKSDKCRNVSGGRSAAVL